MGLAPYGKPVFKDLILDRLIDLKVESFEVNLEYFNYCQGLTMTNHRFEKLFDGHPRKPEDQITEREINLAASIQADEEIVLKIFCPSCLSGGVALNWCQMANCSQKRYLKIFGYNLLLGRRCPRGGSLVNFQLLKRETELWRRTIP